MCTISKIKKMKIYNAITIPKFGRMFTSILLRQGIKGGKLSLFKTDLLGL